MNGGSKIIDLHVSDVSYAVADEPLQLTEPYEGEVFEEPEELEERSGATKWRILAGLAFVSAAAWIGFFAWYAWPAVQAAPTPTVLAELATGLTAPLALIAILWLVARRSSRIEARRFNDTARSMRAEAEHLQAVIDVMAQTIDSNREKLADQVTVMMATASAASDRLSEASSVLDSHFSKAETDAARIDKAAANLEANLQIMLATLPHAHDKTATLADQVETIGLTASERAAALDAQVVALGERAREVDSHTSGAAERLSAHIARMEATSETAGTRLEQVTSSMSEAVDGLLDRTASAVDEARKGIAAQGDAMLAMLSTNQAALDRTATDSTMALADRIAGIEAVANHVSATLAAGQEQVDALTRSIDDTSGAAHRFAGEAAPQLLETLMRIRDTANAAAEHAREAMARIAPDAADALEAAASGAVERSLATIAQATETAATSATDASDKLNRQMLAIAEASGQIEARLADTEEANGFARRVSLLIESLNSAAIDLTSIYSSEVADSSWLAYLKGNRGAFARRAVKLLDAGEMRAVLQAYDNDDNVREQVNRYIHDFEAMLRGILAQRDGAAIGVTLLSSDMGKLYVALAQAIERLRT
jgi:chromosome segregation ATPase